MLTEDFMGRFLFTKFAYRATVNKFRALNLARPINIGQNIAFFGSDELSLHTLKCLHAVYPVQTVVTTNASTPIYRYAQKTSMNCHLWNDLKKDKFAYFSTHKHSLGIVISFGKILPNSMIRRFQSPIINVHPSLLPRWRGASPLPYTILAGDALTAVSIFLISDKTVDTGRIWSCDLVQLPTSHLFKTSDLLRFMMPHCSRSLLRLIEVLRVLEPHSLDQSVIPLKVENTSKPNKEHGNLDFQTMSAVHVNRIWRAFHEFRVHPTCRFENQILSLIDEPSPVDPATIPPLQCEPGDLVVLKRHEPEFRIFIRCQDSWLLPSRFKLHGHKPCSQIDFYNGYLHQLKASSRDLGHNFHLYARLTSLGPNPIVPIPPPLIDFPRDFLVNKFNVTLE
ncbi:hypothetical protein Ciccas_005669 [Cichlidogyrus casuarinus]|uniref:Methionyl-tRNA formyltransferase n=1 Tax=Cichlidogyrus casuarinus TaxID=1844966 RepID=A0ABD2QAD8_9PLAT